MSVRQLECDTDKQDVVLTLSTEGYQNSEVKWIMKEQGKVKTVYACGTVWD